MAHRIRSLMRFTERRTERRREAREHDADDRHYDHEFHHAESPLLPHIPIVRLKPRAPKPRAQSQIAYPSPMPNPLVGVIMGSESDLETMQPAAEALVEFGIPYEMQVVSAHRTPEDMFEYARTARERGLKVIIAGAGGAAHLPGMVASLTTLPVIGVPVSSKAMSGIDSLHSIVQMPPGIPVATMAIGGGKNAGILAVRILSLNDEELAKKLDVYRERMKNAVSDMNSRVAKRS